MQNLFNDAREVLVLQRVYLARDIVGGVGGQHRAFCLKECCAFVVVLVDKVNGYAALLVAALYNSLVYIVAIHTLSAVFGQ